MGRKDRERFLRLKEANPDYQGFRGAATVTAPPPPPAPLTESVTLLGVQSSAQRQRGQPARRPEAPTSACAARRERQTA